MMIIMRRVRHRGVAMLLVLIALGMATIIATSYLSSRDNSSIIGASVLDAAIARWAADSGVELTVAILETQTDWRTAHTNGVLFADLPLAGGTVTVELLDLETLDPPNADTRAVEITAVGSSNGHHQMATAEAYILDDGSNLINVDLSEFAAFASANVVMSDNALIAMWPESPGRHLDERIALGTQSTAMGAITLNNNAAIIDGTVFSGPGASSSLILNANSPEIEQVHLDDFIPAPAPPPSGVTTPADDATVYLPYSPSGLAMLMTDQRWATITPAAGTMIGTKGNIRVVSEDDLVFPSGTIMVVEGNTELVIFDDLIMDPTSYIEVKPGSTLTIYVGDDVVLNDAYIGDLRTADERAAPDSDGYEGYFNPERVKIYGFAVDNDYWFQGQSIVQGTIYSPDGDVRIQDDSAVYGRVTTGRLEMNGNGALFYDPVLNEGTGYTNLESNAYESGTLSIDADVLAVTDLGSTSLTNLATDSGLAVELDGTLYGTKTTDTSPTAPGEPTPRTVIVSYSVTSFGSYVGHWETADGTGGTGDTFTTTQPKETKQIMAQ